MAADLEERLMEKAAVRRIVTGHKDGKSVVIDDADISGQELLGAQIFELWETTGTPVTRVDRAKCAAPLAFKMPAQPGDTRWRLVVIPPDDRMQGSRMHRTRTVDYDIVLSGELWMELDDGLVQLKPGDCVVQNGTRHAWHNRGTTDCIMLSICIGANGNQDIRK
jgi:mannose-6-phosphate isomerase-like protein (cupin superfamily)